jgi:hypothetical protein
VTVSASPTGTYSVSATDTVTISPTETITATPTVSPTRTQIPQETETVAVQDTETAVVQVTETASAVPMSNLGKAIWGPVPARSGQPLTLYFDKTPLGGSFQMFNVQWQNVAEGSFSGSDARLQTAGLSAGFYMVRTTVHYLDGSARTVFQNIIVLR